MDDSQKSAHPRPHRQTSYFLTSTEPSLTPAKTWLLHQCHVDSLWQKELPHEVIASYIGDGAPMLVRRSLGDPDDENFVQDAVLYFMGWYREHKLDNTYVYEGVKESLQAIQKSRDGASNQETQELKMAVLSNKRSALRARSSKPSAWDDISFRYMAAIASIPRSQTRRCPGAAGRSPRGP